MPLLDTGGRPRTAGRRGSPLSSARSGTAGQARPPHLWRATATTPPTNSSPEPDLRGRFEGDDRLAVDKEESLSQPMTFKTSSQSRSKKLLGRQLVAGRTRGHARTRPVRSQSAAVLAPA